MSSAGGGMRVPVAGGSLWAEAAGSGSGIVLLHAGIADARMWDPQWAALTAQHRVARYDLRGFGRTLVEHVAFSNRDDLLAVMDAAGIARGVLVGCSMGGTIALDTAIAFPERVSGLVWVCGGISGSDPGDAGDELTPFDDQEESLMEAKDWAGAAELMARVWVDGPRSAPGSGPQAVRDAIVTMYRETLERELPYGDPVVLDPPAAGRLGEVRAPLLAITGGRDALATARNAERLIAAVPGARRIDLPDVAHLPSLERPDWFTTTLLDFAAEIDAAAAAT